MAECAGALWCWGVMRAGNAVGKRVVREKKVRSLVFRVLSDVDVGEELVVGRQSVLVSPWSVGRLRGFGLQLSDVTRKDVERVATYDGKKPLDRKQSQVVSDAWKKIRAAQWARSEGRRVAHKEHTVVVDALRARQVRFPCGDELRAQIVQTHKFLRLHHELEIRPSTICLREDGTSACNGLFILKEAQANQLLTFYDGVALALTEEDLRAHEARRGWFVATGKSSSNSPVLVGFTSKDTIPRDGGVMSLTNSSEGRHANCKRDEVRQLFNIDGTFMQHLIVLRAKRTISAGEELTWDYNVR